MAETIQLSFSLTRLQRVINPPERLVFTLCGTCVLLITLYGVIMAPQFIPNWIVLGIGLLATWLLFRKQMMSFLLSLLTNHYINTLVIEDNDVIWGVDVPQMRLNRKVLRVGRGLFGTIILRHPYGYSITLPRNIMSIAELKKKVGHEAR